MAKQSIWEGGEGGAVNQGVGRGCWRGRRPQRRDKSAWVRGRGRGSRWELLTRDVGIDRDEEERQLDAHLAPHKGHKPHGVVPHLHGTQQQAGSGCMGVCVPGQTKTVNSRWEIPSLRVMHCWRGVGGRVGAVWYSRKASLLDAVTSELGLRMQSKKSVRLHACTTSLN